MKALLESQADKIERTVEEIQEMLTDLLIYVESSKFGENPYVHKNDIILRVQEIKHNILEKTDF